MAKHSVGTKVKHSRYGEGEVTGVKQVLETPPPFDPVRLDGEKWNLLARLAEIDRIVKRGTEPLPVDKYEITYSDGRKQPDVSELGIDKLAGRATE